jgi:hypothetical protein
MRCWGISSGSSVLESNHITGLLALKRAARAGVVVESSASYQEKYYNFVIIGILK